MIETASVCLGTLCIINTAFLHLHLQVVVRYMGHKAQAQLQLPTVAVRSQDETPAGLWLTVGLLAIDGLALQLRLKRAAKVSIVLAGLWCTACLL